MTTPDQAKFMVKCPDCGEVSECRIHQTHTPTCPTKDAFRTQEVTA